MNTPKTRYWAPEEMYQFEEVSKTWTHQSFSLSQKPLKIISSWLILKSDPLEAHIAWFRPITDTCQRLQVRKCDILKRSEAQSTFSWLLSEEKLPFACINKNVYMDGQVCVSEGQLLSHHTWQVNKAVRRTVSLNERPACSTYTRLCQRQLMEETSTQIRLYSQITEHWKKAGLKSRVKLTSTNMNRVVIFQAL